MSRSIVVSFKDICIAIFDCQGHFWELLIAATKFTKVEKKDFSGYIVHKIFPNHLEMYVSMVLMF